MIPKGEINILYDEVNYMKHYFFMKKRLTYNDWKKKSLNTSLKIISKLQTQFKRKLIDNLKVYHDEVSTKITYDVIRKEAK